MLQVPIAQVIYKQKDTKNHKNFALFHCWQLLKDNEKWKSRNDEPPMKERLRRQDKGIVYREVMKEMLVAKKELEADKKRDKYEQWMTLQAIEERKVAIKVERWMALQAIKERRVAIKKERLRIKKESEARFKNEQDQKIMFMDTSDLNETQKAYVDVKRSQILASTMGFSLGGDFNIGGGEGDFNIGGGGTGSRSGSVRCYLFLTIFSCILNHVSLNLELELCSNLNSNVKLWI